jgi:hypothetical protein
MLSYDVAKIQMTDAGYLMNYPYHMISNAEMCDAFLGSNGQGAFYTYYPLLDDSLSGVYSTLVATIQYYLAQLKTDDDYVLPNWVMSYILGATVGPMSDAHDIGDLATGLNVSLDDDSDFNADLSAACYDASQLWLQKTGAQKTVQWNGHTIYLRPPTIFGEPHVIKYYRLTQVQPGGGS